MHSEIKAVLFDLGGVILSRGLWSFRAYLTETYGVTDQQTYDVIIHTYYKSYFSGKLSQEDFWTGVLADLDITADWHDLKKRLLDYYAPQDGMFELVDSLRKTVYRTYLLSDQTNDWWPILDSKHGITSHFDKTYISAEVGLHKPDPLFYQHVLKDIGLDANQTLFIDDLQKNLTPANELGMKTVFFTEPKKTHLGY